jgi:ABC-type proline/glycine betaine transport system substrate-binding protein
MTPADLRQNPQAVEEPRSSLHALLELPSCIYAPSRAEEPEKLAKIALSSETWASLQIVMEYVASALANMGSEAEVLQVCSRAECG